MRPVEDELGLRWLVGKDDPAGPAVEKLRRAGYRYIVLPAVFIKTGSVEGFDRGDADLTALPTREAGRLQRLRQCLRALSQEGK